jgi:hypothetical protein
VDLIRLQIDADFVPRLAAVPLRHGSGTVHETVLIVSYLEHVRQREVLHELSSGVVDDEVGIEIGDEGRQP